MKSVASNLPPQNVAVAGERQMSLPWYRAFVELHQHSGLANAAYPLWESNMQPASAMLPDADAPFDIVAVADGLRGYAADASVLTSAYFTLQLANTYVGGTHLRPFVQWAPTTSGSGQTRWLLTYAWANNDNALSSPATIASLSTASGTRRVTVAEFPEVDGKDMRPGAIIHCRISRDGSHTDDTYASDALVFEAGVKHMRSGIGTPRYWGETE